MKDRALSYSRRLHHRWEFVRFFDHSQVLRLSECTVFRIPNSTGYPRIGITLKARGSSLDRNRTKRAVREALRQQFPELGSFDYNVVIPQSKKLGFPFPRKLRLCLERELVHAVRRTEHRASNQPDSR